MLLVGVNFTTPPAIASDTDFGQERDWLGVYEEKP